jgi:outer membrane receptor for ferrienterochelin and colicins
MSFNKIIKCICLLQLLIVEGIFAQEVLTIKAYAQNSDSIVTNAVVNIYCNSKLQQFNLGNTGTLQLPNAMQYCVATLSASGFETLYNLPLQPNTDNIFKLKKKNTAISEVVITGQAKNILAENSIYKVQTISAKKIQQQAAQNLAEAIGFENGMNQQQDNILGSGLNIQGIGAQNVKILVNGIPVNGRENGTIDLSGININNAERIEYIKGPMSVMYGTDALGGVINVITKPAKKSFSVSSYLESIAKINNQISIGLNKKRHALLINGARNFFGGWHSMDTFNRNLMWRPKLQYMADAQYVYATSKGKITYNPSILHERIINRGTPVVDPFQAYASDEAFTTKRNMHSLLAEFNLDSNKTIQLSSSVSIYNRVKNKYATNMQTLNQELTNNIGDQDTSKFIDYTARGTFNKEVNDKYSFLLGFELSSQNANSLKLRSTTQSIADVALFSSIPIRINNKLTVQPALRISRNSRYTAPATPSINVSIKLPKQAVLRLSAAKGFRAPSLKELYLNFVDVNHKIKGNDSLKAENSIHLQANTDFNLIISEKRKLKWNINVYYNTIKNQIALAVIDAPTNWYAYANVSNFRNFSIENTLKLQTKKMSTSLGFSGNRIFTADTGKGIGTWDATLQNNIVLNKRGTSLNVFYKLNYKQPLLTLSTYGSDALYNSYLPTMHMANANIAQGFFKNKLQVQLGVKNIFNIQSVAIQGATNSSIHSTGTSQNISPERSYFVALKYSSY